MLAFAWVAPRLMQAQDFVREVKPIFEKHCYECHGAQKQKGGLRLDARAYALRGGEEHKPLWVAGKGSESVIVRFVSGQEPNMQMPPKGEKLSAADIETLKRWIDAGANWPDDGIVLNDPLKTHWAFQPLASKEQGARSMDDFVREKLKANGLTLSAPADARTLVRRLYLDLTGLPPTPEEVEAFVRSGAERSDKWRSGEVRSEKTSEAKSSSPLNLSTSPLLNVSTSPQPAASHAYERLVDKLLDSPRYGERWARHWLDVVRFAETDGFEKNVERPNAWRYRDYVIRALNEDKPFDAFVRDQIAGDQTGEDTAMGFIVGGPWDEVKSPDPVLTAQQRADELNDMVATTGTAFLGLTLQCARCHNHKFDPVPQTDYYSMAAVFSGVMHGERPIKSGNNAEQLAKAAKMREELKPIETALASFEPKASTLRTVVIKPDDAEHTQKLRPSIAKRFEYEKGITKGETDYIGTASDLPTIADGYWAWTQGNNVDDVFAWMPQTVGKFRVWVSWGSGYRTHDEDARYLLDLDGDLNTKNDQSEIGEADHRKFANGTGAMPGRKLWSGFKDLGVHEFGAKSKLLLRVVGEGFPTADVIVLQEDAGPATQPHLRIAATRDANTERFDPVDAKFVRFSIEDTSGGQACIDELEVFAKGTNVARGAKPSASGTLPGHAIHQLAHINDGLYGNAHSWIASERRNAWVQLELARPERIDHVVWSRDRDAVPRFTDRVATKYRIEASLDGKAWRTVASGDDRLPYEAKPTKSVRLISSEGLAAGEAQKFSELRAKQKQLSEAIATAEVMPAAYAGKLTEPKEIHRLNRGEVTQPKEVVGPGVLSNFGHVVKLSDKATDAERRKALADWIADPRNPLTARVIVNRVWAWHFGEGIVSTPSDFGVNGSKPTHPELLDWLAREFIASGWSLKKLHRLICTSATYQQASTPNAAAMKVDAQSRLLWRFPPRRLEAEPLRDCILAVTGKLDLTMGGPGFSLFEANKNYVRVYNPKTEFETGDFRRMIYWSKPRMRLDDTFGVFDCPDAGQVQPKRTRSTTPLQALSLLNSPFLVQQSEAFAERLKRERSDLSAQVQRAFELVFQRTPSSDELSNAIALAKNDSLETLCRAMLNANEFLYVF